MVNSKTFNQDKMLNVSSHPNLLFHTVAFPRFTAHGHLAHSLIRFALSSGKIVQQHPWRQCHFNVSLWKTKTLSQHVMGAGTQQAMAFLRVPSFPLSLAVSKTSSFPTSRDIMDATRTYSSRAGIPQYPWDASRAVSRKGQGGEHRGSLKNDCYSD